ncbi:DUF192 domain-containing protein [Halalkalicoccus ordinarius]|uniref:DUF192 domain-containing protein n=1 Tax=Halalkalicoccus ordinarius TaxID=3116651 RepID=UPI00300EEE3A
MALRRGPVAVVALLATLILAVFVVQAGGIAHFVGSEDRATVTITDGDEELAVVDSEVADGSRERYTGLSDHESLAEDEGMLFVFENEDERSFVMRDMAFPLDILFIDADGRITTIHEAPTEEGSDLTSYRGEAKWVLEVNYGYADERGIEEGDRVDIEYR